MDKELSYTGLYGVSADRLRKMQQESLRNPLHPRELREALAVDADADNRAFESVKTKFEEIGARDSNFLKAERATWVEYQRVGRPKSLSAT